jgi:nucleotide-binding universal stress UspA family protein
MTKSILLCTDRSRNALAAVSLGGRLAAALDAETTLFAAGRKAHQVYRALGEGEEMLKTFGISPTSLVGIGPPVKLFVQQVQRKGYDLVVIGYRKRSAMEKALSGCVAAQVAHQAMTSVLIVRDGRPDIRRLLLGIGGNGFTTEIAEWGAQIASAVGATATLIHVELSPPLMYGGLEEVHQTLTEILETDTPAARALRQAAATMDRAGVQADIKLAYGAADRELLRTAQDGDYDLLIIGSAWARPSINRLVLKNITRNILLKTRRPVLVVYPLPRAGTTSD